MRTRRSPEPSTPQRLRGWVQAAHPFPLFMVLCLTTLIGVASAGGELDAGRLVLAVAAMLFSQLAIGWTNDYVDREHDAVHQPSKPIPSGLVQAKQLPPAIVFVVAVSLVIGGLLGLQPLLFLVIGTAAGLAYDLWLKDTALSGLAFIVAFAVLPPFVWTSLDVYREEFLWLYVVGAPLVVAAHLANVLPDVATDAAAGRRNLAVVLGEGTSLRLIWPLLAAPVLLSFLAGTRMDYESGLVPVTLAYAALVLASAIAYARPGRSGRVWGFRCVVAAAVVYGGGWLAAVG